MTQDPPLVNQYLHPRQEGELDLVQEARAALLQAGVSSAAFDADPNVQFAATMNTNVQRFKLNMWLDIQYLSTRKDVSSHRSMLMEHGKGTDWLDMFKNYHIPAMKSLGLPVALS